MKFWKFVINGICWWCKSYRCKTTRNKITCGCIFWIWKLSHVYFLFNFGLFSIKLNCPLRTGVGVTKVFCWWFLSLISKELSSHMLRKNSPFPFNVSIEELLGEHNFNTEDPKTWIWKIFWFNNKRNLKLSRKDSKPFLSHNSI